MVLGDHEGAARRGGGDLGADGAGALRIEHRDGLIEQEDVRAQRQGARERHPLQLPAGGLEGARRERDVGDQGPVDLAYAGMDFGPGEGQVLRPEGDVAGDGGGDHGVLRLLQHERPQIRPRDRSGELPGLRVQQARERQQHRRLARAARAGEQGRRPGLEAQAEAVDRGEAPPDGTPRDIDQLEGARRTIGRRDRVRTSGRLHGRAVGRRRGHTSSRAALSRPIGKASSTPVRASRRASGRQRSGDSTTPETTMIARYASFQSIAHSMALVPKAS